MIGIEVDLYAFILFGEDQIRQLSNLAFERW
jgi:hypothetical protein